MAVWISELVGFFIILAVLYRYVRPPVSKAMTKQKEQIRQHIEESKQADERRKEAQEAYENAVAKARVDAAKIRDDARADAQAIEEEMRAFAEREVERIKQRGEEQLVLHRQQLARELRVLVGGQSYELADPVASEQARTGLVDALFGGKVGDLAVQLLRDTASVRWSRAGDVIDAVELLARQALLAAAERDDVLDETEDELFRFGRLLGT